MTILIFIKFLDKCKTMYLKTLLGVSKHTSSTFVLEVTKQRSLCEDLTRAGCKFQSNAWIAYNLQLEARRANLRKGDLTNVRIH